MNSEENKSSSGTSESERSIFRKKLNSYVYPLMPNKNKGLRNTQPNNVLITTNLYELIFIDESHKFTLYNVSILPEIATDNFPLKRLIHETIGSKLPSSFKKFFWAGDNLYALITEERNQNYSYKEMSEEIKNIKYNITIKKLKEITLRKVNDFNGENQKVKSIIENLFRNILMKNPKVIKFQDRTIFEDAYIFAPNLHDMGLMATRDFQNYLSLFELMNKFIKPPDLLIYLKASVPTLVEQIQKRGRKYESTIRIDYLQNLNDRYNAWAESYQFGKILTIDTDKIRFADKQDDLAYIIERMNTEVYGLFNEEPKRKSKKTK